MAKILYIFFMLVNKINIAKPLEIINMENVP